MNEFVRIMRQDQREDYDTRPADWQELGIAWVQIMPQRASEVLEGQQVTDVVKFMAETRWHHAIEPGVQLWSTDGRKWEVHTVIDRDHNHEWMDLMLTRLTCPMIR